MRDCQSWQEEMDEVLALGGGREDFADEVQTHLSDCEICQAFLEESLQLNQLLEEPLPLPPAELVPGLMARIQKEDIPEARLPWGERFAWAASGAVAMFCAERIPEYSSSWFSSLESLFLQSQLSFQSPVAFSATTLVLAAFMLLTIQGALVYRTRGLA